MNEEKREFSFRVPQMWDRGLGLGSSHSSLGFFLLLIAEFLPGIHCALGSVYYSSYEIVIPRRLTTREGEEGTGKISYSIFMRGKRQVIHLKQKRGLFANNLPIYTYNDGKRRLDMPFLPKDCYYDGYVGSDLGSLVSLNTCSGLKGVITIEKTVYSIEPIDASSKFEHVLYKMKKSTSDICKGPQRQPLQFRSRPEGTEYEYDVHLNESGKDTLTRPLNYIWSHTKYVEMFVVVEKHRLSKWGINMTKAMETVLDAISLVNTYTYEINIQVVLIGIEVWGYGNRIKLPVNLRAALPIFNEYRLNEIFKYVYHDVAYLIVGYDPGSPMGDAYFQGACESEFSAGIVSFYHDDLPRFAFLMAHELGHNIGMLHDHKQCVCGEYNFCIMDELIHEGRYSNCSKDALYDYLRINKGVCLLDKPEAKKRTRLSVCGNKVLDRREECDCGNEETCASDPCCLPTCRMVEGAACAFGPCCEGCQFKLRGRVCRPSKDECDLPEYCNGTSMWCQPDVYKQNGTPCRGQGLCYEGRCRALDLHCTEIFGEGSRSAQDSCYQLMNTKGDRFGNCGSESIVDLRRFFRKCLEKDIKCGKLMCENVQRLPQMRKHHTFIQVLQGDTWCWAADLFEEVGIPDRGEVHDGTPCGPHQICFNYTCSDAKLLRLECNPDTQCHRRGVCNNLRRCHCDFGYAPPTCEARGEGGSIDSGPPPQIHIPPPLPTTTTTRQTTMPQMTTTTTTTPPPIRTSSSQNELSDLFITPSKKVSRKRHREIILAIFLFLTIVILLVNTVIWCLIILVYSQKMKKRKKEPHQKRPRKAHRRSPM